MRKDLYRVTTYDEFAEHTKAAVANQARGLRGRDPTPMVHFVAGDEVSLIAVEAAFFDSDHPERRRELVDGFVLPLIRERGASAVAFSFAGTRGSRHSPTSPSARSRRGSCSHRTSR
jgi:hypothetical protein